MILLNIFMKTTSHTYDVEKIVYNEQTISFMDDDGFEVHYPYANMIRFTMRRYITEEEI